MGTTIKFNVVTFQEILDQAREWAIPDLILKHKKEFDEQANKNIKILIKKYENDGYTIKYQ